VPDVHLTATVLLDGWVMEQLPGVADAVPDAMSTPLPARVAAASRRTMDFTELLLSR
jgi:hypothetical protein